MEMRISRGGFLREIKAMSIKLEKRPQDQIIAGRVLWVLSCCGYAYDQQIIGATTSELMPYEYSDEDVNRIVTLVRAGIKSLQHEPLITEESHE